jgi:PRTRC genetic system protein C
MLVTNNLERIFLFKDNGQEIRLPDISVAQSPEAVLNFYSQTYPILTNAKIEGPEITDDEVQYKFVSTMGVKG